MSIDSPDKPANTVVSILVTLFHLVLIDISGHIEKSWTFTKIMASVAVRWLGNEGSLHQHMSQIVVLKSQRCC